MKCPKCGGAKTKVVNSRARGDARARRRQCAECSFSFATAECAELPPLPLLPAQVEKKRGGLQPFDAKKLRESIYAALCKPLRRAEFADSLVAELEKEAARASPIPSRVLGEMVMERLQKADKGAYFRYASARGLPPAEWKTLAKEIADA